MNIGKISDNISPDQLPLFPDVSEVSESATEADQSSVSSHFSLPVIMFTHDFLKMCVDNELPRIPILLLSFSLAYCPLYW